MRKIFKFYLQGYSSSDCSWPKIQSVSLCFRWKAATHEFYFHGGQSSLTFLTDQFFVRYLLSDCTVAIAFQEMISHKSQRVSKMTEDKNAQKFWDVRMGELIGKMCTSESLLCRKSRVSNWVSEDKLSGSEVSAFSLSPSFLKLTRWPTSGGNVVNLFLYKKSSVSWVNSFIEAGMAIIYKEKSFHI